MSTLLAAVFVSSLLGSLHCAGMCGGLVAFYAAGEGSGRVLPHLAYNLGRLFGYASLGAIAGILGGALDLAGSLAGVQRIGLGLAGVFILLWGLWSLAQALGWSLPSLPLPRSWQLPLSRALAALAARPPAWRALIIGLLSGLLPCGWLWAFVVLAAGAGGWWEGLLVMSVFWAGTVPILAALGTGVRALAAPLRRRLPVITALGMVVLGTLALAGRARALDLPVSAPPADPSEAARQAGDRPPPCCERHGH